MFNIPEEYQTNRSCNKQPGEIQHDIESKKKNDIEYAIWIGTHNSSDLKKLT